MEYIIELWIFFYLLFIYVYILTLGTLEALDMRAAVSTLRISQAKIVGFSLLHLTMVEITPGVSSRGRLPPMVLGSRSPVQR